MLRTSLLYVFLFTLLEDFCYRPCGCICIYLHAFGRFSVTHPFSSSRAFEIIYFSSVLKRLGLLFCGTSTSFLFLAFFIVLALRLELLLAKLSVSRLFRLISHVEVIYPFPHFDRALVVCFYRLHI